MCSRSLVHLGGVLPPDAQAFEYFLAYYSWELYSGFVMQRAVFYISEGLSWAAFRLFTLTVYGALLFCFPVKGSANLDPFSGCLAVVSF